MTGEISSMIDIQFSCYHYKMHVNQQNTCQLLFQSCRLCGSTENYILTLGLIDSLKMRRHKNGLY